MRRLKLSTKITWNYALIFTSILLLINLAVYLSTQVYNALSARNEVDILMARLEVEIENGRTFTGETLRRFGAVSPFFVLIENGGETVSSSETYRVKGTGENLTLIKDFESGEEATDRVVSSSVRVAGEEGVTDVIVLKDLSVFSFMNFVTLVTLVIASILGIFVSYLVGSYISRQSFAPILSMTKSAAAIGPLNIHERLEEPLVQDELKELSRTFNGLLDRLDDAYSRQAKFVSDASHELRTPLTVIKGYNDLLMRWGKSDPEILDEAISAIRAETDNMSLLVENLLFIAKGENSKIKLQKSGFKIRDLLLETAKDFTLSVPEREFLVSAEDFTVHLDRRMIKQMLRIFIENSVKFTKPHGIITLQAEKDEDSFSLSVHDDGEGIAEEDLKRVFERFYVADKARTKHKAGSGLGLSIARWIAEIHGGKIEAKSGASEGTTLLVTFSLEVRTDESFPT